MPTSQEILLGAMPSEKIPAAIAYMLQLQRLPPSWPLRELLASYEPPKAFSPAVFTEGVKHFIRTANLTFQERQSFYGDRLSGLHYANDLKTEWNRFHAETIGVEKLKGLAPHSWDSIRQDGFHTLVYKGRKPAEGLNDLLKGPSMIDCGMFCQLSLWFGLRYMLGDERFNHVFGQAPLFITQSLFHAIRNSATPHKGNPLYAFFSTMGNATIASAVVAQIVNTSFYSKKHPAGSYAVENTIFLNGLYHIFDAHVQQNQGLTKSQIEELLRNKFNEAQDENDIIRLAHYAENPEARHPTWGFKCSQLIEFAAIYRDMTLTEETFYQSQLPSIEPLVFDLGRVLSFLEHMKINLASTNLRQYRAGQSVAAMVSPNIEPTTATATAIVHVPAVTIEEHRGRKRSITASLLFPSQKILINRPTSFSRLPSKKQELSTREIQNLQTFFKIQLSQTQQFEASRVAPKRRLPSADKPKSFINNWQPK